VVIAEALTGDHAATSAHLRRHSNGLLTRKQALRLGVDIVGHLLDDEPDPLPAGDPP
jgi:hypothetical protein